MIDTTTPPLHVFFKKLIRFFFIIIIYKHSGNLKKKKKKKNLNISKKMLAHSDLCQKENDANMQSDNQGKFHSQ